jgi:hypothetical protein
MAILEYAVGGGYSTNVVKNLMLGIMFLACHFITLVLQTGYKSDYASVSENL